jgi:hypothetical protein
VPSAKADSVYSPFAFPALTCRAFSCYGFAGERCRVGSTFLMAAGCYRGSAVPPWGGAGTAVPARVRFTRLAASFILFGVRAGVTQR